MFRFAREHNGTDDGMSVEEDETALASLIEQFHDFHHPVL